MRVWWHSSSSCAFYIWELPCGCFQIKRHDLWWDARRHVSQLGWTICNGQRHWRQHILSSSICIASLVPFCNNGYIYIYIYIYIYGGICRCFTIRESSSLFGCPIHIACATYVLWRKQQLETYMYVKTKKIILKNYKSLCGPIHFEIFTFSLFEPTLKKILYIYIYICMCVCACVCV